MIAEQIERIKKLNFSVQFLKWTSTLAFIPLAIYLRFVLGTSLILDKNYPDYFQMVFILSLVIGIWLCWKWARDRQLILTGLELYLGVFVISACLSTAFSINTGVSLEKLIGILGYILCVYFLQDIKRNTILWQGIVNALLFTAAISSLAILISITPYLKSLQIGLIQFLADPIYLLKLLPRLPYSLLLHPSITAGYLVLILPLGVYQWSQTRNLTGKIIQGLGIIFNIIVLLLTRSRGGLLGFLFMIAVAAFLYRKKLLAEFSKNKLTSILVSIILGSIGVVFVILLTRIRGFDLTGVSIQNRLQLWKSALLMIRDKPWLGAGPGTFGQEYIKYRDPLYEGRSFIHAHNQILQVIVEFGFVGLISLMAVIWKWIRALFKSKTGLSSSGRITLIALSGLFVILLPDAILTSATIVFLLIFYLVWMNPLGGQASGENKQLGLITISVFSILVGLGASWITWKIEPYYKALIQAYDDNWQGATEQLEIALERDPLNPYYGYALGYTTGQLSCLNGEGFSTPISYYLDSLDSYPNWDISHANLAGMYGESGNYFQAATQMEYAIQAYPHEPFYNCLLGDYYWKLGRTNEALSEYSFCVAGIPSVLDSSYWGESEQRTSLEDEVMKQAKRLIAVADGNLLTESELYFYAGDTQESLEKILEYLNTDPLDLKANLVYFLIMEELGKLPEIETQLELTLKKNLESYTLWLYKGRLALVSGDPSAAENAFIISKLRRPSVYGSLALGNLYLERGDHEIAQVYFQEALEIGENHKLDFSRHVAGRWPIIGIYNNCLPEIATYRDYINPVLETANRLRDDNCYLAACFYNKLMEIRPPVKEAQNQLRELPCFQDFDPTRCSANFE